VSRLPSTPQARQEHVDAFYWYQTIAFGDGVRSKGTVDHAAFFTQYGFPSVAGRTVLDVGASDGYFAFAFERLGAARVLATDLDHWSEGATFDAPTRTRARRRQKFAPRAGEEAVVLRRAELARSLGFEGPNAFYLARALLKSSVELRYVSVYDLASLNEQFDIVFLGTVTTHLADLPAAFEALCRVTRGQAVVACADLLDFTYPRGAARLLFHAIRALRLVGRLEDHVPIAREAPVALYTANVDGPIWRPSVSCVREMLLSAGFRDVIEHSRFVIPNLRRGTAMDHVVFHAWV
jgi:SAM-dependent methyltransferase